MQICCFTVLGIYSIKCLEMIDAYNLFPSIKPFKTAIRINFRAVVVSAPSTSCSQKRRMKQTVANSEQVRNQEVNLKYCSQVGVVA
jgi:hypothetical protein